MSSVGSSVVSPVSVELSLPSVPSVPSVVSPAVDVSSDVSVVVVSVLVEVVPSVVVLLVSVAPSVASVSDEVALVVLADMPVIVVVVDALLLPSVAASLSVVVSSPPQLAIPSAAMIASRCGSGAREWRICAVQNGQYVASTRSGRVQAGHGCMRRRVARVDAPTRGRSVNLPAR